MPSQVYQVDLSASVDSIVADGSSTTIITSTVTGRDGHPVGVGIPAAWTTSLGVLVSQDGVTNEEGKANAVLQAGAVAGTATIRSIGGGRSRAIDVSFSALLPGECRYSFVSGVPTAYLVWDMYSPNQSGSITGTSGWLGPNQGGVAIAGYTYSNPVPEGSTDGLPPGFRRGKLIASNTGTFYFERKYEICKIS
ncbi:Ig-like domain-containing protein [Castellaniella hirudinis]|uniref:Ig-like domain-containing protein n=1 Tax=Castellaniella hirudinis TaxID=1144617 RepID=A0ABV8S026_9BURK